jgi:2-dehydropantoate 2-reductase
VRIAVLGAGAIGGYVGAMLHRAGADVSLVARGAHCEAMRSRGLRVLARDESFTVTPTVTDDPAVVGPVDVVLLGLKAHDYAAARELLEPLLGPETAVVAAQNGIPWWYFHGVGGQHEGRRVESVDPGGSVSRAIPPRLAIGCVVYCSTELAEPGVVRHVEGVRFPLGEPDGSKSERATSFSAALRAAGLKAPVVGNIREHIWLKLMGNAVFNPLSALTGATLEDICRHPGTRRTARAMMEEVLAVATALDVKPQLSIEARIAGAEAVGPHKTSMLQDLEAGKPLELDALVGAVVELAEVTDVPVPALRTVHSAVALLAKQRGLDG